MLSFFPNMYPDELLYSVIARYHKFSGNLRTENSIFDLCEHSKMDYSVVLPYYLGNLTEQAEQFGVNFEDLLYDRTFFPYLTVFENEHYVHEITEWAFKGEKVISNKKKNMWKDKLLDQHLRACPICLEEEKEAFGEGYWHRLHQIPGVLVCPKHKIGLYNSCIPCKKIRMEEYLCPEDNIIFHNADLEIFEGEELDRYVQLANGIQWVFDNFETVQKIWKRHAENYAQVYSHLLYKKKIVLNNTSISKDRLLNEVWSQYPKILQRWKPYQTHNYYETGGTSAYWDQNEILDPLQHFVVMQYLAGSIKQFFEFLEYYDPNQFYIPINSEYESDNIVNKYRACWKSSCELCHNDTQGELFNRIFSVYMWLNTYDQKWLRENPEFPKHYNWVDRENQNLHEAAVLLIPSSEIVT